MSKREQVPAAALKGAEDVIWRINPDMTVDGVLPTSDAACLRMKSVDGPLSAILTAEGAQRPDQNPSPEKERLAISSAALQNW